MDWLNNLSETGRKVIFFIILAVFTIFTFLFLGNNNNVEEGNVASTQGKPRNNPPNTPLVTAAPQAVNPETGTEENDGGSVDFTPPPPPPTMNETFADELEALASKGNSDGLVDENKMPDEETLTLVRTLAVEAASILENPNYAPSDRYKTFSEFLTEYSTVSGEGFNVASPTSNPNAVFTVHNVPYVSYSSIVVEIENSDQPEQLREMELKFDGSLWKVLRYHDVSYEFEGMHGH